jgi:hypothetical protein
MMIENQEGLQMRTGSYYVKNLFIYLIVFVFFLFSLKFLI